MSPDASTDSWRLPAEWEPHDATWLAWPENPDDWPGKLHTVRWACAEIVRRLAEGETVRLLVSSRARERQARGMLTRCGVDLHNVEFFRFPTNRSWTRDYGPIFVRRDPSPPGEGTLAVADFAFNAWAKYLDWDRDDEIARRAADVLGLPLVRPTHAGRRLVLEGGAVDVNGCGALLTTEECLLDQEVQARNPGMGRDETETALARWLGGEQVIWLGRGIRGDDTHGHVDDVARFVAADRVVLARCDDPTEPDHAALSENRERLEGVRLPGGGRIEIIDLPMPQPLRFDGQRLPASYANFYIANHTVLVPTFNDPADREALGILAECFPARTVVGIHAVDLVWGFGTVHCLTQQQPRAGESVE